ncbi:MAG: glycosyltransferase family 2 protein [bacterium]|nr:glycosyltransferase family 2 protein [bacterium]
MLDISIVITNRNGKDLLEECLPQVCLAASNSGCRYEIILVDDNSEDAGIRFVRENFPQIQVISLGRRIGFGEATNVGVRKSKAPILILLNNDVKPAPDSFAYLLDHFQDQDVFAVATRIYRFDGTYLTGNHGGLFKYGHLTVINKPEEEDQNPPLFVCGGAGAYHREKFLELGGFDPLYEPFYYEDVDICYRAWKRGLRCVYEPKSLMYHKSQATITREFKLDEVRKISARNNYLFTWKNITDPGLILSHLFFFPIFLGRDIFRGKMRFWKAVLRALPRLPQALAGRWKERTYRRVRDREILELIKGGR